MDALKELKSKLKKHPQIHFIENNHSIEILPGSPVGFKVELHYNPPGYTVYFEGWHESFDIPKEALDCIGFGLSESCRLKIIMRENSPQKWILESYRNGEWITDSETGVIFFPFWRSKSIVYKQNHLIKNNL